MILRCTVEKVLFWGPLAISAISAIRLLRDVRVNPVHVGLPGGLGPCKGLTLPRNGRHGNVDRQQQV